MSMGSDTTWVGKNPLRRVGGLSDALAIAADLGFTVHPLPYREDIQTFSADSGEKGNRGSASGTSRRINMEKKIETLALITTILKDFIRNKDRIIARLQQPYTLDCIPVEVEYQKRFSELLMKAASDYGASTASVADFQWSQNFKEPPTV